MDLLEKLSNFYNPSHCDLIFIVSDKRNPKKWVLRLTTSPGLKLELISILRENLENSFWSLWLWHYSWVTCY